MKIFFRNIIVATMALCSVAAYGQRFAVLSDIHVTPGNANESYLKQAVQEINADAYDAIIVDGDLSNEGSDEQLVNVKNILSEVTAPLYIIPGNHENNWSQSATKSFIDLWGNDRFVFVQDSLVVVGINCGPFMKMGDGHVKQEDLHWLESTLDSLARPGRRVLSFCHYALNPDLDNYADYIKILERYSVVAHINGHYHTWQRWTGGDIEGVAVRALEMRNDVPGYSVIEIDSDWVHIYNKRIGERREAKYAFAARSSHKPWKGGERAQWTSPEGFDVSCVWADSASIFTRLGFDGDNVLFGTSTGKARAVSASTGALQWSASLGASLFSRPVKLSGKSIAFPGAEGIAMVDARTGRISKSIRSKQGPYVADGTVYGKRLYQGGYKRFECRNANNGALLWSYDSIGNYCQAAPYVDSNDVIFGAWDTNLRCLDARTGRLHWSWNNGSSANLLSPGNVVPVVTDSLVIIVAPDRYITAIDRATGKTVWRDNSHKYRESLGASEDLSRVYAKTMDGTLVAVDARSREFKELWEVDLGIGYEHAPCIVLEKDGVIYGGSRQGKVWAVDADSHSLLWLLPLGVSEVNGIDVNPATGDIYVSLIEGTIFRIKRI